MKKLYLFVGFVLAVLSANAQTWWPQTSNTTRSLRSINFYDNYLGCAFGDTLSMMVKTSNSGSVWSILAPAFTRGDLFSSAFLNSSTIIAVGEHDVTGGKGLVMKTANGGTSWTADTSILEKLFDVSFISATQGWISGENGYIARTADGGTSWLQLTTDTDEDFFSVYFINANEGWAVGTVDTSAVILHTTNGGTNWTRQNSGLLEQLFSVFFINNTTGWAVGAAGSIIATTDGGNTWVQQTSGVMHDLFDVSFISAQDGWIAGANGTILKTTDGGTTWTLEVSGTTRDLRSIIMKNDTLGWVCGDNGTISVYGNNPPSSVNMDLSLTSFVSVYPNPSLGVVNISFEAFSGEQWHLTLTDSNGKILMEETEILQRDFILDINKIAPGVYFYYVRYRHGKDIAGKLIIQ